MSELLPQGGGGALLILAVGGFFAYLATRVVSLLTEWLGLDEIGRTPGRVHPPNRRQLSQIIGLVVVGAVMLPVMLSALRTLGVEDLTAPAAGPLERAWGTLPRQLAAVAIVLAAFILGRVLTRRLSDWLTGMGFDTLPPKLGLGSRSTPPFQVSEVPSTALYLLLVLLSTILAAHLLGFDHAQAVLSRITLVTERALVGLVFVGAGLYGAERAPARVASHEGVQRGPWADGVQTLVRFSILWVACAFALGHQRLFGAVIILPSSLFWESERMEALISGLQAMGARVGFDGDALAIDGPTRLKGARLETLDDPRLAMAFAVAALVAEGDTVLTQTSSVKRVYPSFFDTLTTLGR